MAEHRTDVIIIGAGAAGLACADELCQFGLRPLVLEARERVGGRILTHRAGPGVIELGADFVHGAAAPTRQYIDQLGLSFYEVGDAHLFLENGRLHEVPGFWKEIEKISARVPPSPRHDVSVERFLAEDQASGPHRALYRAYVEGFHAADPRRMSARALYRAENEGAEEAGGDARLLDGYDLLPGRIAARVEQSGGLIRRGTRVREVRWGGAGVSVRGECEGQAIEFSANRLVVTLPIGVLQAAVPVGVAWFPELPEKIRRAFSGLAMGGVERLVLRFRSRVWEKLSERPVAFLHAGPEYFFPTWWTLAPLRTNQIVAWQGGPKALEMAGWGRGEKLRAALQTLARLTRRSLRSLETELEASYAHDWTHDEFSLGAYSYVKVGGDVAGTYLRAPVAEKIFFAGEATIDGEARGTVHGALLSGRRAARRVRLAEAGEPEPWAA